MAAKAESDEEAVTPPFAAAPPTAADAADAANDDLDDSAAAATASKTPCAAASRSPSASAPATRAARVHFAGLRATEVVASGRASGRGDAEAPLLVATAAAAASRAPPSPSAAAFFFAAPRAGGGATAATTAADTASRGHPVVSSTAAPRPPGGRAAGAGRTGPSVVVVGLRASATKSGCSHWFLGSGGSTLAARSSNSALGHLPTMDSSSEEGPLLLLLPGSGQNTQQNRAPEGRPRHHSSYLKPLTALQPSTTTAGGGFEDERARSTRERRAPRVCFSEGGSGVGVC